MRKSNNGNAYDLVRSVYDNSPGKSWRRLNGALQSALSAAIEAHLEFTPTTFSAICQDMNGGYWMGNGSGSQCGEGYYTQAVKMGHRPACISFENFAGRPAAQWAEDVKTPERLHLGSEFLWEGLRVTVTNLRADHLIACTYRPGVDDHYYDAAIRVGAVVSIHREYRTVLDVAYTGTELSLRLGKPVHRGEVKVARRFQIPYVDLAAKQKEFAKRCKGDIAAVVAAPTQDDLDVIKARITLALSGTGRWSYLRHFEIESLRQAITAKEKEFGALAKQRDNEADLVRWMAGERVAPFFDTVRVRIEGDVVATSTGQRVPLEAAKALLPWVLGRRGIVGAVNNCSLDIHPVRRTSAEGIQIGCTLIPWSEVERFAQLIRIPFVGNAH